ncbi:MAG: sulfite exporter TauE/SafE family protein [Leptolyngbya sp. SIO3F4]|nr:sulfite exporter TauE/SafE family protein [Leptolyngbya sp. SIO3F4]
MDTMMLIGYVSAIFIGLSLGLIGGGGSILTVPVLVYLFQVDEITATAYSLFVVGVASLVGSVTYFRKGLIHLPTAILFGIPALLAVWVTRRFLLPALPEELVQWEGGALTKSAAVMILFALLMVAASVSMIRKRKTPKSADATSWSVSKYALVLLEGTVVGVLTGLVGAGGGFLIIPALVILSGLPMKQAVGTSLLIIATKSLTGFLLGDVFTLTIDWGFLAGVSAIAVVGIFIGSALSNRIEGAKLKPAFGWFVLVTGVYVLGRSLIEV